MSIERAYLWFIGLGFLAFGASYGIAPVTMAGVTGLGVPTPFAVIEIRAFYAGQLLGLGALVVLGAWWPRYRLAALLLIAASLGGTGAGRAFGMIAAGEAPAFMAGAMLVELGATAIALYLVRRPAGSTAQGAQPA